MKATVLVDNIAKGKIHGEWGLSIYIEYNNEKFLLDTGSSYLFAINARKLGIDLSQVDYGILSHAHYDHGNGIGKFIHDENKKANFYIRDGAGENCYAKKWMIKKYIGIPNGTLGNYRDRIIFADGDYKLTEGVYLIPHKVKGLEKIGLREDMYIKTEDGLIPDDFTHEQSLIFDTDKGLVIFNSCCHGGTLNIIKEAKHTFSDKDVYALIGGFHLFNKPADYAKGLAEKIKETGVKKIYTGHCTGDDQFYAIQSVFGDNAIQFNVGLQINI